MNDCVKFIFGENLFHCLTVANVCIIKLKIFPCDLANSIHCLLTRIVKIINYSNLVTAIKQFYKSVTSDKACTTRQKNFFHII